MDIAIVLGSKGVNATGLIRSLGMASINVVYASTYSKIESKYVWKYLKLPEDKKKWVNILNNYFDMKKIRPSIFPCDDEMVVWLDENYNKLVKKFILPSSSIDLKVIADKSVMNKLADEAGLNVPKYRKVLIKNIPQQVEYPLILME